MRKYIKNNSVYESVLLTDHNFQDVYEWLSTICDVIDFDFDGITIEYRHQIETVYVGQYIAINRSDFLIVNDSDFEAEFESLDN